jgi:hypothetical protein
VTERYDNPWDTELTPELEAALSHDCEDDPLRDHTMTEAEAAALAGPPNLPKIPVRPCPPRPLRLVRSAVYRVFLRTAAGLTIDFMLNFTPTVKTVEAVLSQMEEGIEQPSDHRAKSDYDKDMTRLENFIALVRLVPVLHIPTPGKVEDHEIRVAGVNVGTVGVKSLECWDIPEGP